MSRAGLLFSLMLLSACGGGAASSQSDSPVSFGPNDFARGVEIAPPPGPFFRIDLPEAVFTGTAWTDLRDVMAVIYVDGKYDWTDHNPAYSFPATSAAFTVPVAHLGAGQHTVLFVFYLQNTTTEIGRASVTVKEGP